MNHVSNLKRVEAIVVRPFTGADNVVRNVNDHFFTTAGRLKNYENRTDASGRRCPLAILYEPDETQETQETEESETVELKAVDHAPENKAVTTYEDKGGNGNGQTKRPRGRPKGSRNKRKRKR